MDNKNYKVGTKVKVDTTKVNKNSGWAINQCIKRYPNKIFTIKSLNPNPISGTVYYRIITEPAWDGATFCYEIKYDYIISLNDLREKKLNKLLCVKNQSLKK